MRPFSVLVLNLLVFVPALSMAAAAPSPPPANSAENTVIREAERADVMDSYGRLPLYFIENRGQVDKSVRFYERGAGHATFFTKDGLVLALRKDAAPDGKMNAEALRLGLIGADKNATLTASSALPGHVNFFRGSDSSAWRTNVPTYGTITYNNVYKNIDVKFYGTGKNIEHDVIVRAGGDPSLVRFSYKGINGLRVTEEGDLIVDLDKGKIVEKKPIVYQVINGSKVKINSSYRLLGKEDGAYEYGFKVASYDHERDLVIDPVLDYSTYLGGSAADTANAIAVDSTGAAYVTGSTFSTDFPVLGAFQGTTAGAPDVFVTKINPTGTALVYSTYIGGSVQDQANAIAVDSSGNAYITGFTTSPDFPTVSPISAVNAGATDIFVTKIDPTGAALLYSTYLGGTFDEIANGIAIDAAGNAYVAGGTTSTDYPVASALQGVSGGLTDVFVSKIDSTGTVLAYSTYLGGAADESANAIDVDPSGNIYITGNTKSIDYPLASPIQTTLTETVWGDIFITKIASGGASMTYSTYLGGSLWESGNAIKADASGNTYVTGFSNSVDFPVASALQGALVGNNDVVLVKIDPAGSALVFSTYIGGANEDTAYALDVDATGNIFLSGTTWSTDYPMANAIQSTLSGTTDAFVTEVDPTGASISMSTYLGGSGDDNGFGLALDGSSNIYVTGETKSLDFPTDTPIQGANAGGVTDAFVSRISSVAQPAVVLTLTLDSTAVSGGTTLGYTVTVTNTTTTRQCFNYWETFTLPDASTYPVTGSLFGDIRQCLSPIASNSVHLTHNVPLSAPVGTYTFNAFLGAFTSPIPVLVDEDHANFDVNTVVAPAHR